MTSHHDDRRPVVILNSNHCRCLLNPGFACASLQPRNGEVMFGAKRSISWERGTRCLPLGINPEGPEEA